MTSSATSSTRVATGAPRSTATRSLPWVAVSAAALVVQTAVTTYPQEDGGVLWLWVGLVLLWFVQARRGRVARVLVVASGLVGALVHLLGGLAQPHALLVAASFLAQAVPLMTPAVRAHVKRR